MCHSVEDVVAVIWLAAAAAGKSSTSLFPQDVVARRRRAARRRLRHRRRRQRFQPQSLLGQDVCVHVCVCVCVCVWAGKSRSGGAEVETPHQVWPQTQREKTDQTPQFKPAGHTDLISVSLSVQCVCSVCVCSVCVCSVCVFSVCVFSVCVQCVCVQCVCSVCVFRCNVEPGGRQNSCSEVRSQHETRQPLKLFILTVLMVILL